MRFDGEWGAIRRLTPYLYGRAELVTLCARPRVWCPVSEELKNKGRSGTLSLIVRVERSRG